METEDVVNKPNHYQLTAQHEVIFYLYKLTTALPAEVSYSVGNSLKYISRAPRKGALVQDIEKAIYYAKDAQVQAGGDLNLTLYHQARRRANKQARKNKKELLLCSHLYEFAHAVTDTYPDELASHVYSALTVWVDYFKAVEKDPKAVHYLPATIRVWKNHLVLLREQLPKTDSVK